MSATREATRDRVEALIPVGLTQYLAEELFDPAYPEHIGAVRCIGGKIEVLNFEKRSEKRHRR
jgi:hypothetical protein